MHFFHSFWKNLHLTENFYTDMSVVSVTNIRYDNSMHEKIWDGSIKQHTLEDIGVSSIQGTPAPAAPLEDAIRRLSTEIIFRCLYNSNEAH